MECIEACSEGDSQVGTDLFCDVNTGKNRQEVEALTISLRRAQITTINCTKIKDYTTKVNSVSAMKWLLQVSITSIQGEFNEYGMIS